MPEQWTQEQLREFVRSGKTNRDNVAMSLANLELPSSDEPLEAKESAGHFARVSITVHSYRRRLADPDGISAKAAIDGLVMCGVIKDDSARFVEEVRHKQTKSKEEKTVIVIEEV